jgi:hypothetical protein
MKKGRMDGWWKDYRNNFLAIMRTSMKMYSKMEEYKYTTVNFMHMVVM